MYDDMYTETERGVVKKNAISPNFPRRKSPWLFRYHFSLITAAVYEIKWINDKIKMNFSEQ